MLTVLEAIQQRRSIRKYVSDDVPEKLIEQMLEAARLSPSGGNAQPWRFVVVRDAEVRQEICKIRSNQKFVMEAPVTIVAFADLDRYRQQARKNKWKQLVEDGIADTLSGDLAKAEFWDASGERPDPPRDRLVSSAISNTFIAIEHLLLMAVALGLGTCWLGSNDDARLNQLFGLPENLVSAGIITVGYPAGKIPPQRPRISMEQMVLKPQVRLPAGAASR